MHSVSHPSTAIHRFIKDIHNTFLIQHAYILRVI
jgi:hypothetical protein